MEIQRSESSTTVKSQSSPSHVQSSCPKVGNRSLLAEGARVPHVPFAVPYLFSGVGFGLITQPVIHLVALALASVLLTSSGNAAGFAETVVSYKPGTGFATEFGSGLGFTNTAAVLGDPSRITPGLFGGPVDPFNPPYLRDQLLSIGAGGSLTVRLDAPALNLPGNPFGIDFMVFGNAGFTITNANFTGGGITDGSLFGANSGDARVFVSTDNIDYFQLSPSLAPGVDRYFPTDGAGDFSRPLNPALRGADFSGRDLTGIRSLYGGSGGGAGFDIGWAQDANGQSVDLASVRFIRIDVLSGVAEIDAIVAVPEPSSWALGLLGVGFLLARTKWRLSKVK